MAVEKKGVLTVKNIRNTNVENILHSILNGKNMTRSMLAKENGISLMTVKHIVDALIADGVLVEKESKSTEVGRNPKVLELAERYGNIICVDLTSKAEISFLIYDIYEQLLAEQRIPLEAGRDYQEELETVLAVIRENMHAVPTETIGAAVFVPSAYNADVDLVNYDLIPEFRELHIKGLFQEKLELKHVLILHDVFAAAKSEYDSLNQSLESQFYFYCGYGVGGCLIHKGETISGEENIAGEIGKMLVSMDGRKGEMETFEELVSISAVKKAMKEYGLKMEFAELLEQFQKGEEQAAKVLTPVLNTISRVLYNLLWVYNPTRLVVDSCESSYSRLMADYFQQFLEKMENDAIPIHVQVRQAEYDEYHTMRGCFHITRDAWIEALSENR